MKEGKVRDNCLYFDISKKERDSAIRYLLGAIINARNEGEFPSNFYVFDEDVNVYLAHLLFAVSLPEYHEMSEPYLSTNTSDVLRWVRESDDRTIRYFIFKVNADHLLVHSTVFDSLGHNGRKKIFNNTKKHYRELAKLYYEQAAAYHKRIYRKRTGVGEVLMKLALYFDSYQEVLRDVRRDYFHFVNNFRDQVFHQFMDEVRDYERVASKKHMLDEFLDLYGKWLGSKDPSLEKRIRILAAELERADPEFSFDLDQAFRKGQDKHYDEENCA